MCSACHQCQQYHSTPAHASASLNPPAKILYNMEEFTFYAFQISDSTYSPGVMTVAVVEILFQNIFPLLVVVSEVSWKISGQFLFTPSKSNPI